MKLENYEFIDFGIGSLRNVNDIAVCIDTENTPWMALYRDDVIALAKHFNLTNDELNNKEIEK